MYGANPIVYVHENGVTITDNLCQEMDDTPEYTHVHENGVSILDGARESRLLSGLVLLAMSP